MRLPNTLPVLRLTPRFSRPWPWRMVVLLRGWLRFKSGLDKKGPLKMSSPSPSTLDPKTDSIWEPGVRFDSLSLTDQNPPKINKAYFGFKKKIPHGGNRGKKKVLATPPPRRLGGILGLAVWLQPGSWPFDMWGIIPPKHTA